MTSCMLSQKRFLMMPAAAPLFLAKTTRKPGEPHSTHCTKTCPEVPYKLTYVLQAAQRILRSWEWCEQQLALVTSTLSPERGTVSLWVLCCVCARNQAHAARHWGKTGNVQPEPRNTWVAVQAHVELKPMTKLYFNYSWVQLIMTF